MVGRIAALENKPFNAYHKTKDAEFYYFECIDDQEVANALFQAVIEATEEAIYNSLLRATTVRGRDGHTAEAIPIDELRSLLQGREGK